MARKLLHLAFSTLANPIDVPRFLCQPLLRARCEMYSPCMAHTSCTHIAKGTGNRATGGGGGGTEGEDGGGGGDVGEEGT